MVSVSLGRSYCIDVVDGWVMAGLVLTVRKVCVLLLAILTVTANHTKRNLQKAPGMTCEQSNPYSVQHQRQAPYEYSERQEYNWHLSKLHHQNLCPL